MILLIVESPGKVNTIQKYLGPDYKVMASVGHIRELVVKQPGFNTKTFEPYWELIDSKGINERIHELKKASSEAEIIYLATDPDREGEAISWHLWDLINKEDQHKCKRVTFNEITKKAITNALENPRDIDMDMVHSQWARRILDRFVGYDLSKLVRNKLKANSAGRVQTVVLLFIVERAKEIAKFVPEKWWTISTELEGNIPIFLREDTVFDDIKSKGIKNESEFTFKDENDTNKAIKKLNKDFEIYNIDPKEEKSGKFYVPFESDTMLTKAISEFHWNTKKVSTIAQVLYEGIEIDGQSLSLITYPRSDTNRLNDDFMKSTKEYIEKTYGSQYVNTKNLNFSTGPMIQGAHEGIRPVDVTITPESLEKKLKDSIDNTTKKVRATAKELLDLYALIWSHTIAALMKPPLRQSTTIRFKNNNYKFYTNYTITTFDGYECLPYWKNKAKNKDLSYLKVGDKLEAIDGPKAIEHSTEPKPYFNEGSLIAELKKAGVGRPSTYTPMLEVVKKRDYIIPAKELPKNKNRELRPTDLGISVVESLSKHFNNFISKEFTANMEKDLETIANGQNSYQSWLKDIYQMFLETLGDAKNTMEKSPDIIVEDRKCPKCGKDLVYKQSTRKGYGNKKFIGCSGWSKDGSGCDYRESIGLNNEPKEPPKIIDEKCPNCNHDLVERTSYNGKFIGCSNYPKCKYIKPEIVDHKCPKCGKDLVVKSARGRKFIGCSGWSKDKDGCTYIEKYEQK